jgi:uncharacterized lipoprotein YajG
MRAILALAAVLLLTGCAAPARDQDDWGAISDIVRHQEGR